MEEVDPDARGSPLLTPEPQDQPRNLGEQIAQLKRRRDELREQAELRALEAEVQQMEQAFRVPEPVRETPAPSIISSQASDLGLPGSIERPAQRRRFNDDHPSSGGRAPKIEKIPIFEGKGIREYQDFESRLGIAFRLDPSAFMLEDQKIAFTLQYLQPTFRQLWMQRELEDDGYTLGWRDMMSFLLDQIKSPINRELQVTILYQKSTQKEGQPVNEFAAYLSTLENQISPPYEQKHLVMHLYSKLRPEIRVALSNYTEFPTTRRELVERAATLEDNLRKSGVTPSSSRRPAKTRFPTTSERPPPNPHRFTSATTAPSRPSFQKKPNSDKVNTCYNCGGTGHWAKDCTRKPTRAVPTTGSNAIHAKKERA